MQVLSSPDRVLLRGSNETQFFFYLKGSKRAFYLQVKRELYINQILVASVIMINIYIMKTKS